MIRLRAAAPAARNLPGRAACDNSHHPIPWIAITAARQSKPLPTGGMMTHCTRHTTAVRHRLKTWVRTVLLLAAATTVSAETPMYSELWGRAGERWSPDSRLPDYSFAGYERGEKAIPVLPTGASVHDYGARGDGEHDDTEAFRQAIAATASGAIEIPPGRYVITDILDIRKSGIVLRGAGVERTTLYFPRTLTDVQPNWGRTTGGRRTSNYSWSGGFVRVTGSDGGKEITGAGPADRGELVLPVDDAGGLSAGMEVMLTMQDDEQNSLTHYIYAGDPGPIENIRRMGLRQVFRITRVEGDRVRLDRPLRFDVRERWQPSLHAYEPAVTHVGIEHLTFAFPDSPYEGHFTELGHNGIAMSQVAHCWVRDVRFLHAESGMFFNGRFSTFENVTFDSGREPDDRGNRGHHGVTITGEDNLFTRFDFRVRYIHDLTVTHGSIGNVFSSGRGVDVNFDHHRRGPYENLFTDIDVGEGTRVWSSGGGASLGRHCAARGTFWNVRARRPIGPPPGHFAPDMINLVGLSTDQPTRTEPDGLWFEVIPPESLQPQNIHEAQRQRRVD